MCESTIHRSSCCHHCVYYKIVQMLCKPYANFVIIFFFLKGTLFLRKLHYFILFYFCFILFFFQGNTNATDSFLLRKLFCCENSIIIITYYKKPQVLCKLCANFVIIRKRKLCVKKCMFFLNGFFMLSLYKRTTYV